MAKEEPKRLLSKMAKFVRHPTRDWSELDDEPEQGVSAGGYSREMLKEMIERRQRNDFVRRREFDALRRLRRRESAVGTDASDVNSSINPNNSNDKGGGRALTLKKIDEIEEQMSQQWWQGKPGVQPNAAADVVREGERPGQAEQNDDGFASHGPSHLVASSSIEEAAIRFAHGDDTGSESILLQALAPGSPMALHEDTWRALLDLYRAVGDRDRFVAASTRYAQTLKRPAPHWLSLRLLARDAQAARALRMPVGPVGRGDADWTSPVELTRAGLADLTRALGAAGAAWTLDWSGLASIDPDAAAPLRTLFAHWAGEPVRLRFAGGARLLEVLEAQTPMGEREQEVLWWHLRMDALRAMHLADDFELAALNYCITYEVSPPAWEDPKGSFELVVDKRADTAAPGRTPGAGIAAGPAAAPGAALSGELSGDTHSSWEQLDADLGPEATPTISCAALVRIDLTAAGTLLNWVMERDARGQRVQFVDAHRLIAPFFNVIGIADHATVATRTD